MWLLAVTRVGTIVGLAALALTTVFLLARSHRHLGRRPRHTAHLAKADALLPRAAASSTVPTELAEWEVRMHELARRLSAQLDSKMSALQSLIRLADEQTQRLETALGAGRQPARPSGPQVATQAAALERPAPAPRKPAAAPRRNDEILALADAGYTTSAIADQTGYPIGEVELILSLRNRG